jgi:alpha-tubulin suppressor-like RCC1 family protein
VRKTSGSVFCWGDNSDGQVGSSPASMFEDLPQRVVVAAGVRASRLVAGGNASCLLDADGAVFCWGNSGSGDGAAAVPSTAGSNAVAVSGASGLVLRSGSVSSFDASPPYAAPAAFFVGASAIARGPSHGCAVRSGNAVHCWGDNGAGQLGVDPATPSLTNPTQAIAGFTAVDVAVGGRHSCALTQSGAMHCWGESVDLGQVGHGVYENVHEPQLVLQGVERMRVGPVTSGAISATGDLRLWGSNASRQIATTQASSLPTPTLREDVVGVVDLALGLAHTCVIAGAREVRCFGANDRGQLGVGNVEPSTSPVRVTIPRD